MYKNKNLFSHAVFQPFYTSENRTEGILKSQLIGRHNDAGHKYKQNELRSN
jgi:hypothetical protein